MMSPHRHEAIDFSDSIDWCETCGAIKFQDSEWDLPGIRDIKNEEFRAAWEGMPVQGGRHISPESATVVRLKPGHAVAIPHTGCGGGVCSFVTRLRMAARKVGHRISVQHSLDNLLVEKHPI